MKNFSGNYASLCTENMNRLSWLLVVCLSKVSANLVNFYFTRQWLKLRLSDVILLKFFDLNRRFEKCFRKTDSSSCAKVQQVSVRGNRSSQKSVGNFVKFGFSRKTSKIMFVRRNILKFFYLIWKTENCLWKICISFYRKHEQIVLTFGSLSLKSVGKIGNFLLYETMAEITYIWRHYAQVLPTKQKVWKMFPQDKQFKLCKTATGQRERQSFLSEKCRKVSLNLDSHGKPQKLCLFDAIYWNLFYLIWKNEKKFRENMHLFVQKTSADYHDCC